ncbi:MAG: hypothetical protein ILM98_02390 [Kiritimatiellae bacterium]|nr:hypothetical protein [Kiritimatiellia bacterium]
MVTIKGQQELPLRNLCPFSTISPEGQIVPNAVTEAFERAIADFPRQWPYVEGLSPHVIMPDHLHFMVKLGRPGATPVALGTAVGQLKKRLREAYWDVGNGVAGATPAKPSAGATPAKPGLAVAAPAATRGQQEPPLQHPLQIFAPDFHDWIVKKDGQLEAFRRYILENPERAAIRRANRRFFTRARQIEWRGAKYWAYGNEALLALPVIVAIKGHRQKRDGVAGATPATPGLAVAAPAATSPALPRPAGGGTREWLLAAAGRIGPGGAGVSTFLSPLEKEAAIAIEKAGGARITLSMQGFGERWHPCREEERLCAEGRLLFLSPYPPQDAKLSRADMYHRAHELVDWALANSTFHLEAWPS